MKDLEKYVEGLFIKYRESKEIAELKDEILSNLEAKVNDLVSNGLEYNRAVKRATQSIKNIDFLIDDSKEIYVNRYKAELLQLALLYVIIAWILTIPIMIVGIGAIINIFLLFTAIVLGIFFIKVYSNKDEGYLNKMKAFNIKRVSRYKRAAWILWVLFIVISIMSITAIQFGSNIWFGKGINISGPYQFAVLAIRYVLPFITIIIPLLFSVSAKLILKYQAGEQDEE
ncbi:MAG: permease prefix domain 1-containing protein [Clostridia bacterium]|nr:permease prefix domain 1-containing protein [Clostridia bacterium]